MKLNLFALACIAAVCEARSRRGEDSSSGDLEAKRQFLSWAAQTGSSYTGTDEFAMRERTWMDTNRRIESTNAAADASGSASALRLKHTAFSAMTPEEKHAHMGFKTKQGALEARQKELTDKVERDGRRKLALKSSHIDWAASGHTGPVKDQGGCGSCYTFSSNTTLEAKIAITTGQPYQRLSEQQIVDCANWDVTQYFWLYGCNGGYMSEVWWYQMYNGAMTDADYPYTSGVTGTTGTCAFTSGNTVAGVSSWDKVDGSSTGNIATALEDGPIAIAVAAYSDTWFQYAGGIVTSDNSDCNPTSLDHAVVLVGYSDGGVASDELVVYEKVETTCRRQKWRDTFFDSGCENDAESLVDDRYCCTEEIFTSESTVSGGDPYWKIQNSWGASWGDDGFIYFAIEEGNGVCGMNQWLDIVTPSA